MAAGGANGYANFDEHERHGRLYTGGKVAASHDGAIIVCMCGEELKLVDVVTGTVVGTVSSEGDEFTSFVMHPTKLELITASRTRQIRHTSLALAPGKCEIVRTWKAHKMPITTMAYDSSGQLLATGSTDQSVMVFNVAKGFCTHVFREHEGVVHRVVFHPDATKLQLFSSSHDNSIRVWDLRTKRCLARLASHVGVPAALAFSPDGATLATATLDGAIALWDAKEAEQVATIDGRRDISGGRSALSRVSRKNSAGGKCFKSLAFSADGSCVLAGGQSKYVCLYDVAERTLLRKYVLSSNVSLDGVRTQLNSKAMTDAGPEQDLLLDDDSEGEGARLPGSRAPLRRSERVTKLAVRATCVRFSPDGRSWAAASTEGLVRAARTPPCTARTCACTCTRTCTCTCTCTAP